MNEAALLRLGASFAAVMADYSTAKSQLAALQHESDRAAAEAGLVYGSSAWSAHRFAACGRAFHRVNELYVTLEDLALEIEPFTPATVTGLLIKARAHQFAGNPAAILTEIETLANASNPEAA
jgi:hypothetical protein